MAQSRRRWIDDVSDEYDSSSEETETQPCSVSPMRRASFSEKEVNPELAADCLVKQLELSQPPYSYLLIGIPYKLNNAKKLGKVLCLEDWDQRYQVKMFYSGPAFSGKAMISTDSREDALNIIKLNGRLQNNRTLTVEVFRQNCHTERRPKPSDFDTAQTEETKDNAAGRCRESNARGRGLRYRARK